mmetsp:Transcript_116691/g.334955  ORF Transcript_116691/g.334955 Transcript_116691/m.334955 type:complete len:460 (-) Transcript_116691:298-1677(-)
MQRVFQAPVQLLVTSAAAGLNGGADAGLILGFGCCGFSHVEAVDVAPQLFHVGVPVRPQECRDAELASDRELIRAPRAAGNAQLFVENDELLHRLPQGHREGAIDQLAADRLLDVRVLVQGEAAHPNDVILAQRRLQRPDEVPEVLLPSVCDEMGDLVPLGVLRQRVASAGWPSHRLHIPRDDEVHVWHELVERFKPEVALITAEADAVVVAERAATALAADVDALAAGKSHPVRTAIGVHIILDGLVEVGEVRDLQAPVFGPLPHVLLLPHLIRRRRICGLGLGLLLSARRRRLRRLGEFLERHPAHRATLWQRQAQPRRAHPPLALGAEERAIPKPVAQGPEGLLGLSVVDGKVQPRRLLRDATNGGVGLRKPQNEGTEERGLQRCAIGLHWWLELQRQGHAAGRRRPLCRRCTPSDLRLQPRGLQLQSRPAPLVHHDTLQASVLHHDGGALRGSRR